MNPTIPPPGRITRWLTHSRARTILTITIAVILSMIGATLAISIAIHDTQTATTPGQDTTTGTATARPPTYSPGELATGDPWTRPRPTPTTTATTPPVDTPPADVARGFMTAWLSGHGQTGPDAHTEWVNRVAVYGTPTLRRQLDDTRLEDLPAATVTDVRADTLLGSANATVTMTGGRIAIVQMMREADGWKVQGLYAVAKADG